MSNYKSGSVKPTVTYTSSTHSYTPSETQNNIKLSPDGSIKNSSITDGDRPWMQYYVTPDEFFELLKVAYEDTFGGSAANGGKCHPEDLYSNVSCVMEIVTNTLSNLSKIRSGKPTYGVIKSL